MIAPPSLAPSVAARGRLLGPVAALLLVAAILAAAGSARAAVAPPDERTLVVDDTTTRVAPGIVRETFDWLAPTGWVRGHLLRVDLGDPVVSTDLLTPGAVTAAEPLSGQANAAGAVAAVNGDFFDINNTKAPLGTEIQGGRFLKSPNPDWTKTAGVGLDGLGRLAELTLDGQAFLPSGVRTLAGLNQNQLPVDGINAYTTEWGTLSRGVATMGAARVHEVTVRGGRVVATAPTPGEGAIAAGDLVLVGREAGADALAALAVSDPVAVQYRPNTSAPPFKMALSGNAYLVRDGVAQTLGDPSLAPRTAVGFSADGDTMWLLVLDGRQADVKGPTLTQTGQIMRAIGADDALNLDGGGSSTLVARTPGTTGVGVVNTPSDGTERPTPNGFGLFANKGSGLLTGIDVDAPAAGAADGDAAHDVFPGLTRRLRATGHDENDGPAPLGRVRWSVASLPGTRVGRDGTLTGGDPGSGTVAATGRAGAKGAGDATGDLPVRVLGDLARVSTDTGKVTLRALDSTPVRFTVEGHDADGYDAPIEPADVALDFDRTIVDVAPTSDGRLAVTPKRTGATVLTATVKPAEKGVPAARTRLPITVGVAPTVVSDFEDPAQWAMAPPARATSTLSVAPGASGNGLKVDFDFTQSTSTRTAGLVPAAPLTLPGQPLGISWTILADGQGEWTSATILDARGTPFNLYGPYLTASGPTRISLPIPAGVQYPIRLSSLRVIETKADRQYAGTATWDDLEVDVPPSVDLPEEPLRPDPQIITNGTARDGGDHWRFATLSDIQFTANDATPELYDIGAARLREIVAQHPDFVVINGDLVDTGYQADIDLAQKLLTDELDRAGVPYYYVPGNHETYGNPAAAPLGPFLADFGRDTNTFDHDGTRFFLLNSSLGSLRGSNYDQLLALRAGLADAATDPAIKSVVLMAHHPVDDPLPAKASQLGDRTEVRFLEGELTRFHEESGGKPAGYVASHAQNVNVERVDGASYMVLPSGGKSPYGTPDRGGFNGWTMFSVDRTPDPGTRTEPSDWLRAEVRPTADRVDVAAPERVRAGRTATVTASAHQPRTDATVPLRYPATSRWRGRNVAIGTGDEAIAAARRRRLAAAFDPATGVLTALRAGTLTLRAAAGETTSEPATITITPPRHR